MTLVTGVPLLLLAGGVSAARGLLLELLHAATSSEDSTKDRVNRACMIVSFWRKAEMEPGPIIGIAFARMQRFFNNVCDVPNLLRCSIRAASLHAQSFPRSGRPSRL